ncbi:MAG TPA: shikimate dehydrogenase [Fibrobacteria bacterium]|nr:shikimate dehydrogenase [Fibrobacteria bacterium]
MIAIRGTTRFVALLGDPVAHSLSPAMHNAAFARHGLNFAYVPLRVRPADVKAALEGLRALGFRGANVTLPHKQAVLPHLDAVSEISRLMGVVNTLTIEDGRIMGTTTDPHGFLEGFREAGHDFAGKSVAVLGNGGSARTIAFALALEGRPARVLLAGRDVEKSHRLIGEIGSKLGEGAARTLEAVALADYGAAADGVQVVVNATPIGMHPDTEVSPIPANALRPGQVVHDIVYVPEKTRLLRDAEALGLPTVGGLGMLVHQGRASFRLWTGIEPDASIFHEAARSGLVARSAGES